MKEKSVKTLILEWLDGKDWTYGGKIEDYIRAEVGAKASNASRQCRKLAEEGLLERRTNRIGGKGPAVVMYRRAYPASPVIFSPQMSQPSLKLPK